MQIPPFHIFVSRGKPCIMGSVGFKEKRISPGSGINGEVVISLPGRYYRFNEQTRTVDNGYPKPISMWSGAPDNIKAAIMSEDGCRCS